MDKGIGVEFNMNNVRQLELLADGLESLLMNKDTIETNFSLVMLNIESFIPNSNIFEYIFKTDIFKREKLKISIDKGKQYEKIKNIDSEIEFLVNEIRNKELEYEKIKLIDKEIQELADKIKDKEFELNDEYTVVDKMNSDLSVMDNQINESEWRVYQGSSEEVLFNFLKNKLIKEKKLIK
jgi:hypothetical protein